MLVVIRKVAFIALIVFFASSVFSQDSLLSRNSLYFELGGNGGFYSINYEFKVLDKKRFSIGPRVGLSMYGFLKEKYKDPENALNFTIIIPVGFNSMLNFGNNQLNVGATATLGYWPGYYYDETFFYKEQFGVVSYVGNFGYRYTQPSGGFMFGLNYNMGIVIGPKTYVVNRVGVSHWGGISVGYAFKRKNKDL